MELLITENGKLTKTVQGRNVSYCMYEVIEYLNSKKYVDLPLSLDWEPDNTINLMQDGERLGWYSSHPDENDLPYFISDINHLDPQGLQVELVNEVDHD